MTSFSGSNQNVDVSDHFRSRENELEGRILKLSSNNAQLLFEIEQSKLRTPRLMVSVARLLCVHEFY